MTIHQRIAIMATFVCWVVLHSMPGAADTNANAEPDGALLPTPPAALDSIFDAEVDTEADPLADVTDGDDSVSESDATTKEASPEDTPPASAGPDPAESGAPGTSDDAAMPAAPQPLPLSTHAEDFAEADTEADVDVDDAEAVRQVYVAPASLARGRPLVAVWMNGIGPYAFVLDTALRRPVVAVEVADYLGLSGAMRHLEAEDQAGNPFVATAALLESFTYAGMPEHPETVAIMDLTALSARLGVRIAGILPAYQPGFEVSINFDDPSVTWRSLAAARLEAPDAQTALAAIDGAGAPRINVRVNGGESIPMVVDLNLPDAVAIPEDTLNALNALDEMTPRLMSVASAWRGDTQLRLDTIQAAGAQLRRPMCRVLPAGEQARLGLGFLRHFLVTLNYEFGLVRLESAGGRVLEAAPLTGYGIALAHVAHGFWQLQVAHDSPAFEAGIRSGDYLLGINDQPVNTAYWEDSGYQFISRLLRAEEGDTIALITLRDGMQHRSYLMARPLLP